MSGSLKSSIACLLPLLAAAALQLALPRATCAQQRFSAERESGWPEGAVLWASRAEPMAALQSPPLDSFDGGLPSLMASDPLGEQPLREWPYPEECFDDGPRWRSLSWLSLWPRLSDDGRHRGLGDPLEGTSWLNRPYYLGVFTGGAFGATLIEQQIDQRGGLLNGCRLGIDMSHYWGVETRLSFSRSDILYPQTGGVSTVDDMFLDASLLYYPLGDAHWRPYLSAGLGLARFDYTDTQGELTADTLAHLPLGLGVKYYLKNWMSLRFDFHDNIAIGARDFSTMNNISLTGGMEFRFGGRRKSYYPFDPGIHPRCSSPAHSVCGQFGRHHS
jgi:hypothetical protein